MLHSKKIPGPKLIDPGISLFYPQDLVVAPLSAKVCPSVQAGFLTFPPFQRPSHPRSGTVAHKAERVPFSIWKGRDYSGGPVPDFNGVPY
jgi:hypothetical protein